MKIKAYSFDHDFLFSFRGQLMTRLPSGEVFVTGGSGGEIELTLHRLGAIFVGEIDGELIPSEFDALCDRVRRIQSGPR